MDRLKAFGLDAVVAADERTDVFPDNWESLRVFAAMKTQWRYVSCGMAGILATGLDYGVLPEVWKRTNIPESRQNGIFRDLQIMEVAAMTVINERREK